MDCKKPRKGFTLVELLVVIGIIGLLISILLPVLGKARAAANTTKCLANLRTLGQGMALYVNQYRGAIPGSGNTSGRHFYDSSFNLVVTSATNIPAGSPIEVWDFVTPIATSMALKFRTIDDPSSMTRYLEQAESQYFHCPSATDLRATAFPVGSGPDAPILGYVTSLTFMMTPGNPNPGKTGYTRISTGTGWWALPSGYFPRITKIGKTSEKLFAADGAKYTYQGAAPTYSASPEPISSASTGNQGKYSDWGAWTTITGSYDQWTAGGNDGRVMSFRHGKTSKGAKAGSYKMNAVFFDGHAETLDDVTATNPRLWLPTGTKFTDSSKIPPAVATKWNIVMPYTVQ